MTLKEGYVWFLPVYSKYQSHYYLDKNTPELNIIGIFNIFRTVTLKLNEDSVMNNNISCKAEELNEVLKGHLALSYAAFGSDSDVLPTKKTVGEWKDEYTRKRNISTLPYVDYAPYVYDAIWVYAKAIIQLIKEGIMFKF